MQLSLLTLTTFAAFGVATPLNTPRDTTPFTYKSIDLTFTGAAASYSLSVLADGQTYPVSSSFNINLISTTSDFGIYNLCNFYFPSGSLQTGTGPHLVSGNGGKEVQVGTPEKVVGVNCAPTSSEAGRGLPVYATCQWCGGGSGGCFTLSCESGYCAATKCRPTTNH